MSPENRDSLLVAVFVGGVPGVCFDAICLFRHAWTAHRRSQPFWNGFRCPSGRFGEAIGNAVVAFL